MLYYNTNTVKITNVDIDKDLEQIFVNVESKENPENTFRLCAFYIRKKPLDFGTKQINKSSEKWNEEIKSTDTFIAIGDSNAYYHMNTDNDVIHIKSSSHTLNIRPYIHFIIRNGFKQMNPFGNFFHNSIDVCLVKSNQKIKIICFKEEESILTPGRTEKAHNPLTYYIYAPEEK